MSTAYGTAIVKKKSGRILDVELHDSAEDARRLVEQQNAKTVDWDVSTEWKLVRVEVVDEESELQWRVRDTAWGGDRMGAETLMRRYRETHGGVLECRRKAGPWTEAAR